MTDNNNLDIREAIKEQATEEEHRQSQRFPLRKIIGGDILTTDMLRRQTGIIVMIAVFTLLYVSNRYKCQQDVLEIADLKEQLIDAKYKALAVSSQLTEATRESRVLEMLKANNDSTLHIASQPPFIISVPEEGGQQQGQ